MPPVSTNGSVSLLGAVLGDRCQASASGRRAKGKSARDVRRCLKRAVARQLFKLLERYGHAAVEVLTPV
jgi:transposase